MDTHTQTVAEAVAAATQQAQAAQQQQQQQHHTPPPPLQLAPSSTIDNLTCQWQNCGERCDSAESLYDHVCERHVGRKSTNNLNLTCQWGACRTTTVKRDHITSHIRVHVPLKPHKCDFCGKAFKRPQDLKKHVKTHADDSVLINSPSHGQHGRSGSGNQAAPSGYYPASHEASMHNPYNSYQPAMATGGAGHAYQPPAATAQYAGYGNVSYPNSSLADIQSMDTRRRAIEALNEFLGDIKRRAIDPTNYYDVGHRLQSTALPLPVGSGYNTGYNNSANYGNHNFNSTASLLESFNNGTLGNHTASNGVAHGYSLPLPNARTKNDLQDIDRFLEQLQATVYETSNHSHVQPPVIHTGFPGDYSAGSNQGGFRPSNSPPNFQHHLQNSGMGGNNPISSAALTPGVTSSASSGIDTPALTPASVSSYSSSGHSPVSSAGRPSFTATNMYPSLPSVTGMSDGSNYPTATSAPASGLASGFDYERRYSGGKLMATKEEDTEMEDVDDGSRTPKAQPADEANETKPAEGAKPAEAPKEGEAEAPKAEAGASLDPTLRPDEAKSPESASTPAAAEDKRQEEWVENIRVIEALRNWISERLKVGDFEDAEAQKAKEAEAVSDADMKTVETAKMVAEKLAVVERANKMAEGETKYPSLPLNP